MRHAQLLRTCLLLLLLIFVPSFVTDARAQAIPETAGPLVGHTTSSSTSLWMYAKRGAAVKVVYGEAAGGAQMNAALAAIDKPAGEIDGTA